MKNKKVLLGILSLLLVGSLAITPAAQAAEKSGFAKFKDSIAEKFQKFTLRVIPGKKDGKKVLGHSFKAMEELEAAKFKVEINASAKAKSQEVGSFKFGAQGPMEIKEVYDPQATKQDLNLYLELKMEGTSMAGNVDMKIDGEQGYLRINELPALPGFNFTELRGEWLSFETKSQDLEEEETTAEQEEQYKEAFMELVDASEVSKAVKEKINDKKYFVIEAQASDEAIIDYVDAINQIDQGTGLRASNKKQLEQFLDYADDLKVVFWVDPSKFYIEHIELPMRFDVSQMLEDQQVSAASTAAALGPMAAFQDVDSLEVNLVMDLSEFNQPVSFEAPEKSRDLDQAMQEVMMNSYYAPTSSSYSSSPELPDLTPEQQRMLERYEQ